MQGESYIRIVTDCIERAWETQKDNILTAASWVAENIEAKKNVFVFGCSHAGILAEEVFYRTGGLEAARSHMEPCLGNAYRPPYALAEDRLAAIQAVVHQTLQG